MESIFTDLTFHEEVLVVMLSDYATQKVRFPITNSQQNRNLKCQLVKLSGNKGDEITTDLIELEEVS